MLVLHYHGLLYVLPCWTLHAWMITVIFIPYVPKGTIELGIQDAGGWELITTQTTSTSFKYPVGYTFSISVSANEIETITDYFRLPIEAAGKIADFDIWVEPKQDIGSSATGLTPGGNNSVSVQVFYSEDETFDAGEGVANVSVTLDGEIRATTATNDAGVTQFNNLNDGDYTLTLESATLPLRSTAVSSSQAITLPGDSSTIYFRLAPEGLIATDSDAGAVAADEMTVNIIVLEDSDDVDGRSADDTSYPDVAIDLVPAGAGDVRNLVTDSSGVAGAVVTPDHYTAAVSGLPDGYAVVSGTDIPETALYEGIIWIAPVGDPDPGVAVSPDPPTGDGGASLDPNAAPSNPGIGEMSIWLHVLEDSDSVPGQSADDTAFAGVSITLAPASGGDSETLTTDADGFAQTSTARGEYVATASGLPDGYTIVGGTNIPDTDLHKGVIWVENPNNPDSNGASLDPNTAPSDPDAAEMSIWLHVLEDNDGVPGQSAGDNAFNGVVITLIPASGGDDVSLITDPAGFAQTTAARGIYTATVNGLPDGYNVVSGTNIPDSDLHKGVIWVERAGDSSKPVSSVTIHGTVFVEKLVNQQQDTGEPGIPGVQIRVEIRTVNGATQTANLVSDGSGAFSIEGLPGQTYVFVPDESTLPSGHFFSIGGGQSQVIIPTNAGIPLSHVVMPVIAPSTNPQPSNNQPAPRPPAPPAAGPLPPSAPPAPAAQPAGGQSGAPNVNNLPGVNNNANGGQPSTPAVGSLPGSPGVVPSNTGTIPTTTTVVVSTTTTTIQPGTADNPASLPTGGTGIGVGNATADDSPTGTVINNLRVSLGSEAKDFVAAFVIANQGNTDIALLVNNEIKPLLENTDAAEQYPSLNADGTELVYISDSREAVTSIVWMNLNTGETKTLFENTAALMVGFYRPVWVPNEDAILVTLEEADRNNIYKIDLTQDTAQPELVVGNAQGVSVASNGWYVAFSRIENNVENVYTATLPDLQERKITSANPGEDCHAPVFGIDPLELYFTCTTATGKLLYQYGVTGIQTIAVPTQTVVGIAPGPVDGFLAYDDGSNIYFGSIDGSTPMTAIIETDNPGGTWFTQLSWVAFEQEAVIASN